MESSKDWDVISKNFREKHGYKCDVCGVDCSQCTFLLDVHHKDSVRTNNAEENLQCLCKYHHSQAHRRGQYVVDDYMPYLCQLWEEQGIPKNKRGGVQMNLLAD